MMSKRQRNQDLQLMKVKRFRKHLQCIDFSSGRSNLYIFARVHPTSKEVNSEHEEEDYYAESTRADDDNDLEKNDDESTDENEALSVNNSRISSIASPEPLCYPKGNLPQKRKSDSAKHSKDVVKKGNMAKSDYLDDMEIKVVSLYIAVPTMGVLNSFGTF